MSLSWNSVYDRPGPFATVLADVSLANEVGSRALRTLAQSIGLDLDELGASPGAVEHVRGRMSEPVTTLGPSSRYLVATAQGVVVDEVLPMTPVVPLVEWEPLPDPGPLLTRESSVSFLVGGTQSPQGLRGDVEHAAQEAVRRQLDGLRAQIAGRLASGTSLHVGVGETLEALAEGQLEVLALDLDRTGRRHVDVGDHPGLDLGAVAAGSVRADLVLLAGASRRGVAVVVAESTALQGQEAVGLPPSPRES